MAAALSSPDTTCEPHDDPVAAAREAGLRYISDATPGIRRKRRRGHFVYELPDGSPLTDEAELRRVRALVIPPAWTDVWISPTPRGHLQATGRDARNRKQYRYHPRWRAIRDEDKYGRMLAFGEALPAIRQQTSSDLARPGLPREKVLAAVVSLLESTLIRIGNEEYARDNHSFGLTTMRNRHVGIAGATIEFHFRGKSGKAHTIALQDRRLANVVRRLRELPGYELFQYVDHDGARHSIGSGDVNDYLRAIAGESFTAKDFRTWAGTVLALTELRACEPSANAAQAKKNVVHAIESVAERLGNTPTVCRKCYVYPALLEAYLEGRLPSPPRNNSRARSNTAPGALHPEERDLLHVLRRT